MTTLEELTEIGRQLPEPALREVLDFARFLRQRLEAEDLLSYAGCLAQSPHFGGDPLALQKALRDEWR